jgi:hypothetical protein
MQTEHLSNREKQQIANLPALYAARDAYIENKRINSIPANPDPDVLALMDWFNLNYGRSRMLKVLSFGLPVDADLLLWSAGKSRRQQTLRILLREMDVIRKVFRGIEVVFLRRNLASYIVKDERALAQLRAIMARGQQ